MTANEWLKVMEQASDFPKGMEKLIIKYGEMLIEEHKQQVKKANIITNEEIDNHFSLKAGDKIYVNDALLNRRIGAKAMRDGKIPSVNSKDVQKKCERLQDNSDDMCPDCLQTHYEGRNV